MKLLRSRVARAIAGIGLFLLAAGCRRGPDVMRVVDGRLVGGAYVEPEGYASFLRGAIADARSDTAQALAAYTDAASRDADDPEIWTRIGDVRCRVNAADPEIAHAVDRALRLDPEYEPALAVRARCGMAHADPDEALNATRSAAAADPMAVEPQLLLARAESERAKAAQAHDRLLALTLVHRESTAAWDALASWARAHGDPMLAASALAEGVRLVPARKSDAARQALDMAGDGELLAARALAAAAVDAPGPQVPAPVARLAIDEALATGDADRARLRATRAHLGLDEVAARALLAQNPALARAIAAPLAEADSHAIGARMVLAAAAAGAHDRKALARAFDGALPSGAPVPMAALLLFASVVADASNADDARRLVDAVPHESLLVGDALHSRLAADLAARGVLRDDSLPLDARIELAARRREPPPQVSEMAVDRRHYLLDLALLRPADPVTQSLARHLSAVAARDPLVAVALARIALAGSSAIDATSAAKLSALDPADPLSAAAALDLAKRGGDVGAIGPARARLTALARTPAERALVAE